MERCIAYRVERIDGSTSSVWCLSGHIDDLVPQCIGNFNSQKDVFEVLERISGIQGVDGRDYYPVGSPVHVVSASLHFDGISEALVPYATTENRELAADADEDEQLQGDAIILLASPQHSRGASWL